MNTDAPQPKKQDNALVTAGGVLGALVGYYCGLMILIPLAGAAVAMLVAKQFSSAPFYKPFSGAVAIIFGHLTWMVGAALFMHAMALVMVDFIIIVVGLLWLTIRPGLGPVILLGIYELAALVMNIVAITQQDFGTVGHKALTAHIALRLFALAALISGYLKLRKNQNSANPVPGQSPFAATNMNQ